MFTHQRKKRSVLKEIKTYSNERLWAFSQFSIKLLLLQHTLIRSADTVAIITTYYARDFDVFPSLQVTIYILQSINRYVCI